MEPPVPPPEFDPNGVEPSCTSAPSPLERLRQLERPLRRRAVITLSKLLSRPLAAQLRDTSQLAEESLEELAGIDLDAIDDREFRPARIQVGLLFVGFGALALGLLMLYLFTLRPELSPAEQVSLYWYPYAFFVSFGVAGMFMLGREALRPPRVFPIGSDRNPLDSLDSLDHSSEPGCDPSDGAIAENSSMMEPDSPISPIAPDPIAPASSSGVLPLSESPEDSTLIRD